MSTTRDYVIHVRLTGEEYLRALENTNELDTTMSAYIRALLHLPIEALDEKSDSRLPDDDEGKHVLLVYDKSTYYALMKQLRAWGYHFDRSLHALNIIASKRFMTQEDTIALVDKAISYLSDIEEFRKEITATVELLPLRDHAFIPARARCKISKDRRSARGETEKDD